MSDKQCKDCKYFGESRYDQYGACHLNPPVFIASTPAASYVKPHHWSRPLVPEFSFCKHFVKVGLVYENP